MQAQENVHLSQYSTMRLGGSAAYLGIVEDQASMLQAMDNARNYNIPLIMIGGGSNIIWRDEGFPGLVLVNRITGFEVTNEDEIGTYISIGSGENWDSVVERTVNMGLSGIECLSLIPGTAGATPIQNVGAYGQDISQVLVTLTAYDSSNGQMVTLAASDCNFGYRVSRFNTYDKGRFFISSITLLLRKINPMPPFYPALATYLEQHDIKQYTPKTLRDAVIDIRQKKLPDPAIIPNCGSFFANPIVDPTQLETLQEDYSGLPHWTTDNDLIKLSAAWLVSKAGFEDYFDQDTGIATCPTQPLVFINRSAKTTADLMKFADKVKTKVKQQFGVELTQEPLLLP